MLLDFLPLSLIFLKDVEKLTAVGATLCTGAAGSALPTALLAAGEVGAAWAGMLGTVRTGRTAFDELLGESADLLYHLIVLLRARGLSLADAERVLAARGG